ncbi:hypothetical protein QAD02_003615 [Eretmocerus hayati]|uniref:Uncharacterized protein n=1 Tax=Eretmocerus hayati TaxID=131215 RepID=A0ACC2NP17_9HYME|nr:hypothetical protein QAD02_003615 [Eretmocerus hayati]
MTNFENYGIYTPTREQRSQLKRKGDEDFVTQTDDDFDSEYDEEPEKTSRKRRRGMLPSEKVNLTAADKELADIILRGNNESDVEEDEDKENEHCGDDGTLRTSRPGTPVVDLHQPEEIDNTEGSGRNTPEDRVPLLDNRHGEDALPPTAVEVPQGSKESKRMKIACLEEENEKLRAVIEKRDRKIVNLKQNKLDLEAMLQNGKLRVSPTAERNRNRMIAMPPKQCVHRQRKQPYPLFTDGYQLPEFVVAHAKTSKTVKEFTKFVIPILFTREEWRDHSLYGASVASNKFDPRPALPFEQVNAVLSFEGEFGDEYRKMQPKRRTPKPASGGTA